MSARPSFWSDRTDDVLRRGRMAGKSSRTIALELTALGFDANRNVVLGRSYRLGLSVPSGMKGKRRRKAMQHVYEFVGCRWPFGDPAEPGFHFCEKLQVVPGKPYCVEHCRLAYYDPNAVPVKAPVDLPATEHKPKKAPKPKVEIPKFVVGGLSVKTLHEAIIMLRKRRMVVKRVGEHVIVVNGTRMSARGVMKLAAAS